MRSGSFGRTGLTALDRLGNALSLRAITSRLKADSGYILDLGSGFHARLLCALRSRFDVLHAVDFQVSPELLKDPKFRVSEGTIDEALAKIPDGVVDVVLLISVLEHLKNPSACLSEINRVLRPGGVVLVNVPSWRGKWCLELAAFRLGLVPFEEIEDHKMYYDVETLWPLMIEAGFLPSFTRVKLAKFGLTVFADARKSERGQVHARKISSNETSV